MVIYVTDILIKCSFSMYLIYLFAFKIASITVKRLYQVVLREEETSRYYLVKILYCKLTKLPGIGKQLVKIKQILTFYTEKF